MSGEYSEKGVPLNGAQAAREGWEAGANPHLDPTAKTVWFLQHAYEMDRMFAEYVVPRGDFDLPPRGFGTTCPILRISERYDADYADCLRYADYLLHRRVAPGYVSRLEPVVMAALEWHADAFNRLRKGVTP
jgi:hypothetical protein